MEWGRSGSLPGPRIGSLPGPRKGTLGGWWRLPSFSIFGERRGEEEIDETNYSSSSFAERDEVKWSNCQTAEDCGADHLCAGGVCIPRNSTGTGAQSGGSGGAGGSSGCNNDTPDDFDDCIDKNCATGPKCGNGEEKPNCCGNPIYTCGSNPPQCEPCDPPEKECNNFCDSWFKSNGTIAPGCDGDSVCGSCSECSFENKCKKGKVGNIPCWCSPGNEGCPDCEECQRKGSGSGDCLEKVGLCNDETTCTIVCPCGTKYRHFHSQEHYLTGLAAPAACRIAGYQKYCVDGAAESCPPQKDPCKADPGNKCEKDCYCTSQKVSCSGTYSCPDGHRCQVTGELFAATGPNGQCSDSGDDPTNPWSQGGKTIFLRVCKMADDPDCEECDCNCENDCPDCHTCINGECVYDTGCDTPCDIPCNGSCCFPGESCKPGVLWQVVDACHNQGSTVVAPAGVTPQLVKTVDVLKEDAVCDRYHTHCNILVNGVVVGTHLDCQKGLKRLGEAGRNLCG